MTHFERPNKAQAKLTSGLAVVARLGCLKSSLRVCKSDIVRLGQIFALIFCATALADGSDREKLVKIVTQKDGEATRFFAENLQVADVTITVEMSLDNLTGTVNFPYTATLAGERRTELFTLSPKEAGCGWNWTYTYFATLGSLHAAHDDNFVYALPYAPGKSFRVSQGFNGEYSHFGANQYAVDWKMAAGTPVHAARDGLVVGVKSDSDLGGPDSKFDCDANYILIRHSDKTLGQYVHLSKGGTKVKVGDRVKAGDLIGLSGNTGHTTGPHLHFSVFKAKDGKERQSIPIRYKTAGAVALVLEKGKSYQAPTKRNDQLASETPAARGRDILGVALP